MMRVISGGLEGGVSLCRQPGGQGALGGDQGQILGFLHVLGAEHGPTGLAGSHDVAVVATQIYSDRKSVV